MERIKDTLAFLYALLALFVKGVLTFISELFEKKAEPKVEAIRMQSRTRPGTWKRQAAPAKHKYGPKNKIPRGRVKALLMRGWTDAEVARELGCSEVSIQMIRLKEFKMKRGGK